MRLRCKLIGLLFNVQRFPVKLALLNVNKHEKNRTFNGGFQIAVTGDVELCRGKKRVYKLQYRYNLVLFIAGNANECST